MRYSPLGDQGVLIELGDSINDANHRRVRQVFHQLSKEWVPGVIEIVPALASVAVYFDPASIASVVPGSSAFDVMVTRVQAKLEARDLFEPDRGKLVEIPVCYGGEFGPDLASLASTHGLSEDEVVSLHTAGEYTVYMLGFMPGFPYLGGLDARLATPRRSTPRTIVEAGSVAIGGHQTGIYPIASPGGWHLIGRTPLRLFTPELDTPTLLRIGDRVRFREITLERFAQWDRVR